MGAYNEFRFLGICYGDAKKKISQIGNRYYSKFTLVVRSKVNKKKSYIPISAHGEISEKASLLCRNGNKIGVCGEIVSNEHMNMETGEIEVSINFIANDIMLIEKPLQLSVNRKVFSDLIETASIDEYTPPKERN